MIFSWALKNLPTRNHSSVWNACEKPAQRNDCTTNSSATRFNRFHPTRRIAKALSTNIKVYQPTSHSYITTIYIAHMYIISQRIHKPQQAKESFEKKKPVSDNRLWSNKCDPYGPLPWPNERRFGRAWTTRPLKMIEKYLELTFWLGGSTQWRSMYRFGCRWSVAGTFGGSFELYSSS